MQYPASFSESLGDHELKLPFFVRFLKVSFLWPRKKWMPFYSENPTGGKVLHTKPYQCWMRFAEAMGRKFWAKSSTDVSMDVLEDSQYLLISTCEENLPKDSQRIPETCTPKPPFPWNMVAIPLSSFSLLPPLLSTSFIPFSSYTPLATPCVFPRF